MTSEGPFTHILSADLGIKAAPELLTSLRQIISTHKHVVLDTEQVTSVDITTVQTLLSARKKAMDLGGSLSLASPLAPAFRAVLETGGFVTPDHPQLDFWPSSSP